MAMRVRVTGRVQGVGYRAWTADAARGLGLTGWVRNEADGAVTAVLSGSAKAVDEMIARMRQGPSAARVNALETAENEETAFDGAGFEIRH